MFGHQEISILDYFIHITNILDYVVVCDGEESFIPVEITSS